MSYDTELAALLSEPWNESVCRGYTILALARSLLWSGVDIKLR